MEDDVEADDELEAAGECVDVDAVEEIWMTSQRTCCKLLR
jgi:hypothetical protein